MIEISEAAKTAAFRFRKLIRPNISESGEQRIYAEIQAAINKTVLKYESELVKLQRLLESEKHACQEGAKALSAYEEQVCTLTQTNAQLQKELKEANGRRLGVEEYAKTNRTLVQEIERLKVQLTEVEKDRADKPSQRREYFEQTQQLSERVEELEKSVQFWQGDKEHTELELHKAQQQRDASVADKERLVETVEYCEQVFLQYERMHRAKNPPSDDKADENKAKAEICRAAIDAARSKAKEGM